MKQNFLDGPVIGEMDRRTFFSLVGVGAAGLVGAWLTKSLDYKDAPPPRDEYLETQRNFIEDIAVYLSISPSVSRDISATSRTYKAAAKDKVSTAEPSDNASVVISPSGQDTYSAVFTFEFINDADLKDIGKYRIEITVAGITTQLYENTMDYIDRTGQYEILQNLASDPNSTPSTDLFENGARIEDQDRKERFLHTEEDALRSNNRHR